ncbi:MAG: hypothetical protein KIT87_17235 [Anaerolineae bacterium]|nr:hypothetical protein [Anaerolineae bacterium]
MTTLCEAVPQDQLLSLAVAVKSPTVLAQTFAAYVGQFYDRTAFDALARQVADLYALDNAERAARFRSQLDRRLCDRYHTPVAWEVDEPRGGTAP